MISFDFFDQKHLGVKLLTSYKRAGHISKMNDVRIECMQKYTVANNRI